ncbi:MAG: UdgX family uracil-DNA binding protein [Bradymonadaceae bacterium]
MSDDYPGAEEFLPEQRSLEALRGAAPDCRGCPLYRGADHVVFGEGPADAEVMVVGEIPGRNEDEQGRPFVGRAGSALDEMLQKAGLDREAVFVTNTVKHIKWEEDSGNPRSPYVREIEACRPWLESEIAIVEPGCIVALGTTAGRGLTGSPVTISKARGELVGTQFDRSAVITYHPAAALWAPSKQRRTEIREMVIADLELAKDEAR